MSPKTNTQRSQFPMETTPLIDLLNILQTMISDHQTAVDAPLSQKSRESPLRLVNQEGDCQSTTSMRPQTRFALLKYSTFNQQANLIMPFQYTLASCKRGKFTNFETGHFVQIEQSKAELLCLDTKPPIDCCSNSTYQEKHWSLLF